MDWITMSCLISYLRWGSKLGTNSKIDFCLLWAKLWHVARVKHLSPSVEVGCSRTWNRDGVRGISILREYRDAVIGTLLLVQDSGSELMCWCVWAALLPKHKSLVEHAQPWVVAQLSRCGTLPWPSLEELVLCEMQQHLSGQEFQVDMASAPVVWWECPVFPAWAVPVGPCCPGLGLCRGMDGWMEWNHGWMDGFRSAVHEGKCQKPPAYTWSYFFKLLKGVNYSFYICFYFVLAAACPNCYILFSCQWFGAVEGEPVCIFQQN